VRIGAVGDLHLGIDSAPRERESLTGVADTIDVLLLAGDLTQHGSREEGRALARALHRTPVPVVAVLGNHDHHLGHEAAIRADLREAGVIVLDGETAKLEVAGVRLGVAGVKGFGGGFAGACASEFGEPEMKAFIRHTKETAARLCRGLEALAGCDVRVALMHYAPVEQTLQGERLEIYPFLGSYLLAEAVDAAGCDLVVHGHAHRGAEQGVTPGGVPVRNVARPVIRRAYKVYRLPVAVRKAAGGGGAMLRDDEPSFDDAAHRGPDAAGDARAGARRDLGVRRTDPVLGGQRQR
jgi:Icc-related predicted phosphoesterase